MQRSLICSQSCDPGSCVICLVSVIRQKSLQREAWIYLHLWRQGPQTLTTTPVQQKDCQSSPFTWPHHAWKCSKIPKWQLTWSPMFEHHGLIYSILELFFWSDLRVTVQEIQDRINYICSRLTSYLLLVTSQKSTLSSWSRDWAASPILRSILSATPASSQ